MQLGELLNSRKKFIAKKMMDSLDEEVKLFLTEEQNQVMRKIVLDSINELYRTMTLVIAARADLYIQSLAVLDKQILPNNFNSETYPLNKLGDKLDERNKT